MPIVRVSAQEQKGIVVPKNFSDFLSSSVGEFVQFMVRNGCTPQLCKPGRTDITPSYATQAYKFSYLLNVARNGEQAALLLKPRYSDAEANLAVPGMPGLELPYTRRLHRIPEEITGMPLLAPKPGVGKIAIHDFVFYAPSMSIVAAI